MRGSDPAFSPDAVRDAWADREGEYSPRYYAYRGPNETSEAVRERLDDAVGPDASVLELGCSAGRHLAHLHEHGYRDLHGVDINPAAAEALRTEYPRLAADATVHIAELGAFLRRSDPNAYDAVYAVETLQHLPPGDAGVIGEIARVAGTVVVTAEIEAPIEGPGADAGADVARIDADLPLYYRDWGRVFDRVGCREIAPSETLRRDTVRRFRVPDAVPDRDASFDHPGA